MRLKEFEGEYLRLHIHTKIVLTEKVYWLGGRVVSVHYIENGKRRTGRIFLPYSSGKSVTSIKEELKNFIKGGKEND